MYKKNCFDRRLWGSSGTAFNYSMKEAKALSSSNECRTLQHARFASKQSKPGPSIGGMHEMQNFEDPCTLLLQLSLRGGE